MKKEQQTKNTVFVNHEAQKDFWREASHPKEINKWAFLWATILRDLKIWSRYKAVLLGGFFEMTILIGVFGFLATLLSFRDNSIVKTTSLSQMQVVFLFYLGGILLIMFNNSALWTPVNTVRRDLYNGTLEYVFVTPVSRYMYFVSTIIADMLIRFVYYFPILIVIIFLGKVPLVQVGYMLLVTGVALFSYMGIGVIMGVGALQWKNVNQLTNLLGNVFNFIAGAFVPIALFPDRVKWIVYVFPQTYAYDLIRYYSFNEAWVTVLPVFWEWVILGVYGFVLFVVSIMLLRVIEQNVKKTGLNLI